MAKYRRTKIDDDFYPHLTEGAKLVGNLFGIPPKRTQRGQSKNINLVENSPHAEKIGEKPDAIGLALA